MKKLLSNPFVARALGAVGAGGAAYATGQVSTWQGAAAVALSFLGYSVVHSATTAVAAPQSGYLMGSGQT